MEKEYNIYNLIKKYEKYFDENIILKTNDEIINFNLNIKSFSHLIGLQYINNGKSKAHNELDNILNNKLEDIEILKNLVIFNPNFENAVKNRIKFIDGFLINLENAKLVGLIKNENNKYHSEKILLQTKDNKVLELALHKTNSNEYYLESFFVRNNDNNVNYENAKDILGIYIKDYYSKKYLPFSYDINKNEYLLKEYFEDSKNFDYQKTIQEYNKEKVLETKNKGWNKKNMEDLER